MLLAAASLLRYHRLVRGVYSKGTRVHTRMPQRHNANMVCGAVLCGDRRCAVSFFDSRL
jgi:hypothetical protein